MEDSDLSWRWPVEIPSLTADDTSAGGSDVVTPDLSKGRNQIQVGSDSWWQNQLLVSPQAKNT